MIPPITLPIGLHELESFLSMVGDDDVARFEHQLATYLNVKTIFALNSGRVALAVALKSLRMKPGSGIILPGFVCPILYDVIVSLGFKPIPADVSLDTYNIDARAVKIEKLKQGRVIIPVHLFGRVCEMEQIIEMANDQNLFVIEDAAQALGAKYTEKRTGTFGDMAVFSFGLGKPITGGSGGALVVNNSELVESVREVVGTSLQPSLNDRIEITKNILGMRLFSNTRLYSIIRSYVKHDIERKDEDMVNNILCHLFNEGTGVRDKYRVVRMHPLSAKIAGCQLGRIGILNKRRIRNAKMLTEIMAEASGKICLPFCDSPKDNNIFLKYPIRVKASDKTDVVVEKLLKMGIEAERPYTALRRLSEKYDHLYNSMRLVDSLVNVPCHPCLSDAEIAVIGSVFKSVIGHYA